MGGSLDGCYLVWLMGFALLYPTLNKEGAAHSYQAQKRYAPLYYDFILALAILIKRLANCRCQSI
jgi:hypothetical protein